MMTNDDKLDELADLLQWAQENTTLDMDSKERESLSKAYETVQHITTPTHVKAIKDYWRNR